MEKHVSLTRIIALFFAGFLLAGTAQAASLYKWTDAEGNVHYSQTPPEGQQADRMKVEDSAPPASEADAQQGDSAEGEDGVPASAEKDTKENEVRRKNCEIARSNLVIYQTSDQYKQPDGKVITVSDEMRKAKIDEAQKQVDTFCK